MSVVGWAQAWLKIFARLAAALLVATALIVTYEAVGGGALMASVIMLALSLAWAVPLLIARRTAIVLH